MIKFKHAKKMTDDSSQIGVKIGRVLASPMAKTLATENGIDLREVVGTGPRGRIVVDDVRKILKGNSNLFCIFQDNFKLQ